MPELNIKAEHLQAIREHGERTFPHECCGFLLGPDLWQVEAVVPATNSRGEEERHNRFVITPEASMRAEKEARKRGLVIVGHYHSHPNAPARPSSGFPESDLESATWPGFAFVIVSVMGGRAAEVTCWNLAEDRTRFESVPILRDSIEPQGATKMPVTVMIPTALRSYADGVDTVQLSGANVGDVLKQLGEKFPRLKPHLFSPAGELRNFVNVFVNDQNIRDAQQQATAIKEGDEVAIVPAVAGGNDCGCGGSSCSSGKGSVAVSDKAELPDLTREEIARYSRQLILPEVGVEGQKKLKAASILMIGTGGLGAPLGLYLAAAGVGRLGLVDFDVVDHSNLHRQVIHGTSSVGKPKIQSAAERIRDINPNVKLDLYEEAFTSDNAFRIAEGYDLIIDGTDNFPTRYLVNDVSVMLKKPNVYGAIFRFDGQASVFGYQGGPCYRCLYPEPPDPGLVPSCAEGGVLGVLPGIIGMVQAIEAIKIILGQGTTLSGRLMMFDALAMKFREMKIRRDPQCPVCGDHPTITQLIDYKEFCGMPQEEKSIEKESKMAKQSNWDITVQDLKKLKDSGASFDLIDVREPHEFQICQLGGKLIPLGTLAGRLAEFDKAAHIVVHCRSGGRSAKAVNAMREAGFQNVWNVQGGILAWADQIDPSVPKY